MTLFDCRKVGRRRPLCRPAYLHHASTLPPVPLLTVQQVVSGKSWVVFSEGDIVVHKSVLLRPESSM